MKVFRFIFKRGPMIDGCCSADAPPRSVYFITASEKWLERVTVCH